MANSDDELTIEISDLSDNTITSSMNSYSFPTTGAAGSYYVSTGAGSNGTWSSNPYIINSNNTSSGLYVTADAEFEGDIKWKGRSLGDLLATIEKRLAILTPDPAKLEHFEALQKAYQHYKTLEALCEVPKKTDDGS
jgi:hypothetical protein